MRKTGHIGSHGGKRIRGSDSVLVGLRLLHFAQDMRTVHFNRAAMLHFLQQFSKFVTGYGTLLHLLQEFRRFVAS